jgi:CheY-like chemotaxis protein
MLVAICLIAIATAMLSLRVLAAAEQRAAVAATEQAAASRWLRNQADGLETDLRRVLMLTERAKQSGASVSRIELADAEHDLLQHEIALLEADVDWSAGAATLFDLRQLLAEIREQLVAPTRAAALRPEVPVQPVRALTGDAPEAISLLEKARAEVVGSMAERTTELQRRERRMAQVLWFATAGCLLLIGACAVLLQQRVVRPLQRVRAALHRARTTGEPPAVVVAGNGDIAELAAEATAMIARIEARHVTRSAALREQLVSQSMKLQEAERARERAEQSSRNRTDFIQQLGHELRTPLNGMLGLIDLLADEVRSDTGQRRLQSIQGAARALRGVLDRMSEVSAARLPRPGTGEAAARGEVANLSTAAAATAAGPTASPPGARVLVAEDHAINQVVITEMLEHLGHSVEVVPDGRRAVERVRDRLFDVVLMDWAMPEMDGVEATRLIRAEESRSGRPRVPIIALTAHTVAENRRDCFEAGMDDFLAKPVSVDALDAAIRRAVA